MALDSLPPWLQVRPDDFVQAGASGASAGLGASRIRQAGEQHSAQLAMEAKRLQQQAAMEAQRISQAEHIAQMEMETRKEISDQNRIRQDQQALITNAYRQAEMGLEKSRIDQRAALAQQKAQEAALTFAQESSLAQHIAQGGDLATGLMKFPRARGIASALKGQKEELGPVESTTVGGGTVLGRKGSSHWQYIPNAKDRVIKQADGSIIAIKPDNTIETIQGPKTSSDSTLAPGIGAAPVEKPNFIQRILGGGGTPAPVSASPAAQSPFKEGQKVRNKEGKIFIIRNGEPVPMETNSPTAHDEEE